MYREKKISSSRQFRLIFLVMLVSLIWGACDHQTPTSVKDQRASDPLAGEKIIVSVLALDFDYLANNFHVTVQALAVDSVALVTGEFLFNDSVYNTLNLTDDGLGDDILPEDHLFNAAWMPTHIDPAVDRDWTFRVKAISVNGDSATATDDIRLTLPVAPNIDWISVPDTLQQDGSSWVWDTLRVKVSHPEGLDEIRDVNFWVKAPGASSYGLANLMYDDGGAMTFIVNDTLNVNTFDSVAGDGIYSYPVGKSPTGLTGMTFIKFVARAWNGQSSADVIDSMFVKPTMSPPGPDPNCVTSTAINAFPWN